MTMASGATPSGPRPIVEETLERMDDGWARFRKRVQALPIERLADRLGEAEWLDGAFSAGDLMMVHALQRLKGSGLLEESLTLAAYVARGEERPAYRRAFEAQLAINAPGR